MSVWSDVYSQVSKEPIRRIIELALKHEEVFGLPSQALLYEGQAPADLTINELHQAADQLLRKGICLSVGLGGMMGPSLCITRLKLSE